MPSTTRIRIEEKPAVSALRVGDQVLVRSESGPLETEAVMFAPGPSRAPTTARDARARLARSSLTAGATQDAAAAFGPETLASYARADCVRSVLALLGPVELFQGRVFYASTQSYDGMWLDLRALAADLGARGAGLAMQGIHLVALLDELAPDVPLSLENGGTGEAARIAFLKPQTSIAALRVLRPRPPRARWDDEESVRRELARSLRDRIEACVSGSRRARLTAIERELAAIDRPASGPLANPDAWMIELQMEAGDPRGARDRIDSLVHVGGDSIAIRYLRARLALLDNSEPAARIAERLLSERRGGAPFRELELLKARAWKEAGNWSYAKYFARQLVDDADAPDRVALAAHELLEEANERGTPSAPMPPDASDAAPATVPMPPSALPAPPTRRYSSPVPVPESWPDLSGKVEPDVTLARIVVLGEPAKPTVPEVPTAVSRLPTTTMPLRGAIAEALALRPEVAPPRTAPPPAPPEVSDGPPSSSIHAEVVSVREPRQTPIAEVRRASAQMAPISTAVVVAAPYDSTTTGAARPSYDAPNAPAEANVRGMLTAPPPAFGARPRVIASPAMSEEVETLSLPAGLSEQQLVEGTPARTIDDVRIVSTRLSRTLARDYRHLYGVRLRTDPTAIEWMQRHLAMKAAEAASPEAPQLAWELRRHGAFLSEILARMLGAYWVDVGPSELGYWAMFVPPRTRTWPFGRVSRFVALGHREKDLVSYYLDLVERARGE